jgi:hypothetical protein
MTDKTTAPEPGSIDNPLGPSEEQRAQKWAKMLEVGTAQSEEFIERLSQKLMPALELSEKLGAQANSLMITLKLMDKQKEGGDKEKAVVMLERIRPVLTLRETLDVYVTNSCEQFLDELEKS